MAKIRQGFVSNSSSSSFIIAKAQIGDEKWNKLVEWLKNPPEPDEDEDDEDDWGDEMYPRIGDTYIYIDTSECNTDPFFNFIDNELGLKQKVDYMTTYS
jgi:hypothetical protein